MIAFHVPTIPVAQPRQRHRVIAAQGRTFVGNYTPAKHPVNAFKASVQMAARQAYQGPPIAGALELTVVFLFPRPGRLVWKKRPMPRCHHASKPDCENVLKALQDALSGIVFVDDAQVCSVKMQKWYAAGDEQPGCEVEIVPLSEIEFAPKEGV